MSQRLRSVFLICACVLVTGLSSESADKKKLPRQAETAVNAAIVAAKARSFEMLRAMMASEFTWSFGDGASADAAIEEWKRDPRYLQGLVIVLEKGCHLADADHIQCPGRGGMALRAGFVRDDDAWKLEYLVEGD